MYFKIDSSAFYRGWLEIENDMERCSPAPDSAIAGNLSLWYT